MGRKFRSSTGLNHPISHHTDPYGLFSFKPFSGTPGAAHSAQPGSTKKNDENRWTSHQSSGREGCVQTFQESLSWLYQDGFKHHPLAVRVQLHYPA